jgi:histidyl-tRNA synthetase
MNNPKIEYKVPKGTRDFTPQEVELRQYVITTCENIFKLCDAQQTDTPTFELTSVLMEKYGDDANKEIYELKTKKDDNTPSTSTASTSTCSNANDNPQINQVEKCALRYDQTVPFSRYIKTNGISKMRRYQIGKVFRRDQPNMKAARYREFSQCDFDILGDDNEKEVADAECISVLNRILQKLKLTKGYIIKVNNRNILRAIFEHCQVPEPLFQTICSSIDKLDKKGWGYVFNEMTTEKHLPIDIAKKLKDTLIASKKVDFTTLNKYEYLPDNIVEYLKKFAQYLCIFNCEKFIKLDFTLARGLDYYTGLIFEVELKNAKEMGSVAAGGRYDTLCNDIDCVGFSLGIDRISTVVTPLSKRSQAIDVKLISPDDASESVFMYRMKILTIFRDAGIKAGAELRLTSNLGTQINKTLKQEIPFIAFIGTQELKNETVSLKNLDNQTQTEMTVEDACKIILGTTLISQVVGALAQKK